MLNNIIFENYSKYLSEEYTSINVLNKRLGISNRNFEKLEISNTIDKNCKYC